MPDQFSPGQLQQIQAVIVDLCQQNKIPFFVFSFGITEPDRIKQVVTITGQPHPKGKHGYIVEIVIDKV